MNGRDKTKESLSVFFEDPFYVGVFERFSDGKLSVCKIVFGAEPKDGEVYDFVLKKHERLIFSPAVEAAMKTDVKNPKRSRREAGRQPKNVAIGTKSQRALALLREERKKEKCTLSKQQQAETEKKLFLLKQRKRKEKHKGH